MRRSWLILLVLSAILLGSGPWLVLESAAVLRFPSVRRVCSAIQKPDILWAMTDKECRQFIIWDRWEQTWEARLVAIGHTVTVLGMIAAGIAVWDRVRNESRRATEASISKVE